MKNKEFIAMSGQELLVKLSELQKELIKLNAQVATGTALKNPGLVNKTKKGIATIKMILHQKDITSVKKKGVQKSNE